MKLKNICRSERGAALPEYILVLSLTALALLTTFTSLTGNMGATFGRIGYELSGGESMASRDDGGGTRGTEPPSGGVAGPPG